MLKKSDIEKQYQIARARYADLGVDTGTAMKALRAIAISIHCWQGDDVGGFENKRAALSGGGIHATGNYPGKARTVHELRLDLEKVYSLIPGNHRLNLHAIYGEFGAKRVNRDEIEPDHFKGWIDWAKINKIKLDFNATCFAHPNADSGFTLSSKDEAVRKFWINHVDRCRRIANHIGVKQDGYCIHNLWIPDGSKDIPIDRLSHRELLKKSLDEIFSKNYFPAFTKDALESKLFGIGSESYVVGSHEFYLGYAIQNKKLICLDMGHFHPTESVADKISSILQYSNELLLHISRGVRWDSDHAVILNDDLKSVAEEIVRGNALARVHIALDFFDASINRVGAWVIGARAMLKALLIALLEPVSILKKYENSGDNFARLAFLDEIKMLPAGAVWDFYCLKNNVPPAAEWIPVVHEYEKKALNKRK